MAIVLPIPPVPILAVSSQPGCAAYVGPGPEKARSVRVPQQPGRDWERRSTDAELRGDAGTAITTRPT